MKTKITFLLFALAMTFPAIAAKFQVTTITEFNTAFSAYSAGDTIELAAGTYALGGDKTFTKSVTIMAADTLAANKPTLTGGGFIFGTLTANTSFVLNGVEAYYYTETGAVTDSKYFLQAVSTNIANFQLPVISLRNCKIHGYSRGLIRADSSTGTNMPNINLLFVQNCLIYDISRVRADYSIFACKTAKFTKVVIRNSTFYNSPAGVWYNENTDTQVDFLMDRCCLIKTTNNTTTGTQTNVSKMIIYNNGNSGSTRTIRNTLISDSFDGSTNQMQIKFGCDGTTNYGNLDNVILGNNMNATVLVSSTLTTDNRVTVSSFTYDYATLTLNVGATTSNMGDPRWTINNVTTGICPAAELNVKVFSANNKIQFENLPAMAKIEIYSVNGQRLYNVNAIATSMSLPLNEKMAIVRVEAQGRSKTVKIGF